MAEIGVQHDFWGVASAIGLGIIGVAVLATVVSKNATTPQDIQATGSAFSQSLATALSPVTGTSGGAGSSIDNSATFPIN
jgi:hypothetical protein